MRKSVLHLLLGALVYIQYAFAANYHDRCQQGYATLNGGTSGGSGGAVTTVSSLAALKTAVAGDLPGIVVIVGTIVGNEAVLVGSNKSVLGTSMGATLIGVGLKVRGKRNVIIRNLKIQKCVPPVDAVVIELSNNVWVDHMELSSDMDHDKDYYNGLLDVTHATDYITVQSVHFHDHWEASLIGHSDSNGSEDTGHLRVTYYLCHFQTVNSHGPTIRFGTIHILNGWYERMEIAINIGGGAQALVENTVFEYVDVCFTGSGYLVVRGSELGTCLNTVPPGGFITLPYLSTPAPAPNVKAIVAANQGAILIWT